MNQQLSTDLIYAILTMITERTDGEVKKKYKKYDFYNINEFLIEQMLVRHPKNFGVLNTGQLGAGTNFKAQP